MQIKLPQDIFPFLPGTHWVDSSNIFFLTEEHGRKVIKYGFSSFSSLYCVKSTQEGFVADDSKTAEAFPLLLDYLAEHVASLQDLDFGSETDKIAQIKYVRAKYDLGLKEAKEMVEGGGLPPVLKVWTLPHTNFPSAIPSVEGQLAYVEGRGIFPVSLLQQKHLQPILDWQPELTLEEVEVNTVYLFQGGEITAIASKVIYSYYKYHTVVKVDEVPFVPNEDQLVGTYASIEEAKSHYGAFKLGVEKATQAYKSKLSSLVSEWEPRF